jgi:hypothetical protein
MEVKTSTKSVELSLDVREKQIPEEGSTNTPDNNIIPQVSSFSHSYNLRKRMNAGQVSVGTSLDLDESAISDSGNNLSPVSNNSIADTQEDVLIPSNQEAVVIASNQENLISKSSAVPTESTSSTVTDTKAPLYPINAAECTIAINQPIVGFYLSCLKCNITLDCSDSSMCVKCLHESASQLPVSESSIQPLLTPILKSSSQNWTACFDMFISLSPEDRNLCLKQVHESTSNSNQDSSNFLDSTVLLHQAVNTSSSDALHLSCKICRDIIIDNLYDGLCVLCQKICSLPAHPFAKSVLNTVNHVIQSDVNHHSSVPSDIIPPHINTVEQVITSDVVPPIEIPSVEILLPQDLTSDNSINMQSSTGNNFDKDNIDYNLADSIVIANPDLRLMSNKIFTQFKRNVIAFKKLSIRISNHDTELTLDIFSKPVYHRISQRPIQSGLKEEKDAWFKKEVAALELNFLRNYTSMHNLALNTQREEVSDWLNTHMNWQSLHEFILESRMFTEEALQILNTTNSYDHLLAHVTFRCKTFYDNFNFENKVIYLPSVPKPLAPKNKKKKNNNNNSTASIAAVLPSTVPASGSIAAAAKIQSSQPRVAEGNLPLSSTSVPLSVNLESSTTSDNLQLKRSKSKKKNKPTSTSNNTNAAITDTVPVNLHSKRLKASSTNNTANSSTRVGYNNSTNNNNTANSSTRVGYNNSTNNNNNNNYHNSNNNNNNNRRFIPFRNNDTKNYCLHCNKRGHNLGQCYYNVDSLSFTQCQNCDKIGHRTKDCWHTSYSRYIPGTYDPLQWCTNCFGHGHATRYCESNLRKNFTAEVSSYPLRRR